MKVLNNYERTDNFTNSRRRIVAKYAENIYLLQPVTQINRIEKQRSIRRDSQQKNSYNAFANAFNQAKERHEQTMKQSNPNGFDKVC